MAKDVLANGFVRLCIDPSLNFYDDACRVLVIGQTLAGDAPAGEISQVNNTRDLVAMFGQGSVLTESLRINFCADPADLLYALPLADPAAGVGTGVAAVYTLTITGPATADGRFTMFLGEDGYSIDVPVLTGETVAQIAAKVVAAISDDFPYTAAVISTGVTLTAKNLGIVGNYLNPVYNWAGRRNYAPGGVTVAAVRTVAGVGAPAVVDIISLAGECCYDVVVYLGADIAMQQAVRDYLRDAWNCDKPQCFGQGYVYNAGTLGQVLATGDNSPELCRMAYGVDSYELPYLLVSNFAALTAASTCANPELSVQGPENGVLDCIAVPESCQSVWTYPERIQLQEAGFVTYGPGAAGMGGLTNPVIYNDVTNYLYDDLGKANATFRDTNSRRLTTATALSIAEQLQQYNGLALFTKNTKVRQGVRGTNPRLILADLRAWAKDNIGVLFSEFDDIDKNITVKTDFEVAATCRGNPNLLWVGFEYRQPVRIGQINTNLKPKLLDNCVR